ncbi:MAG: class II fructose-bisphosphatase [Acidobacteria bacterium]|nr:class II fructose-bisphosphatase [Acidobacteriota bacterium]MBI3422416.1 class II fructose-bisphosphatase [Acidobacteriota bacterium]
MNNPNLPPRPLEYDLLYDFLRVVEAAAIASARTMGQGERKYSDHVAVETMRTVMDTMPMDGTIVIGEGERDEAPMLYIGERLGLGAHKGNRRHYPKVDIAVDPLEGTNLCATGSANAIAVLAAAEKGGLLHAPDIYMNKIVVGPSVKGAVDIDAPVRRNLKAIAKRLHRKVEDLVIVVMDRPRHKKLINEIRAAGARIQLISDGDLSAGISAAVAGSGVHALMGIGGGPEGVITAAAMRCLNGEIQARFVMKEQLEMAEDRAKIADGVFDRMQAMGIKDPTRVFSTAELAPGNKIIFAACGVTEGTLMRGVRFFGHGKRTHSLIMTTETKHVRFVDTVHVEGGPDAFVRFDK